MLTTSANPNDIADSESQPDVEGLYQKPLSIEKIEEIWKSTTI